MPTYVYKFVETGETIEVQQAFTDDALTEATHPRHRRAVMAVKKVFTPVGVTFKGGGFYKTDSRGVVVEHRTRPTVARPTARSSAATPQLVERRATSSAVEHGSSTPVGVDARRRRRSHRRRPTTSPSTSPS